MEGAGEDFHKDGHSGKGKSKHHHHQKDDAKVQLIERWRQDLREELINQCAQNGPNEEASTAHKHGHQRYARVEVGEVRLRRALKRQRGHAPSNTGEEACADKDEVTHRAHGVADELDPLFIITHSIGQASGWCAGEQEDQDHSNQEPESDDQVDRIVLVEPEVRGQDEVGCSKNVYFC